MCHKFHDLDPRKVLSHGIGGVVRTKDLPDKQLIFLHLLLGPQHADLDMPQLAVALALGYADRGVRVDLHLGFALFATVRQ